MKYWHNQGRHQKIYERLQEALVPDVGRADSEAGEIIRVIGNVVYDVGNNGGCNFDSGRKTDLDEFIGFLNQFEFGRAAELHEQLAGLAAEHPERHCATCDCQDDFKQYPPLDENLLDEAVDLLVIKADRLSKRVKPSTKEKRK